MSHIFDNAGDGDPWDLFVKHMEAENAPFSLNVFHNSGHFVARIKAARQLEGQLGKRLAEAQAAFPDLDLGKPLWEERDGVAGDPENAVRAACRRWGIQSKPVVVFGVPVGAPVSHGSPAVGVPVGNTPPAQAGGDIATVRAIKSGAMQAVDGCLWPGARPMPLDLANPPEWFDKGVDRWLVGKKPVNDAPAPFQNTPAKAITWRQYAECPALHWKLDSFTSDNWFAPDLDQTMKASPDQLCSGYKNFLAKALATQAYARTVQTAPPVTTQETMDEDVPF